MTSRIMALGWYVQFATLSQMNAVSDFFAKTIGLPRVFRMRSAEGAVQDKDHFWSGETVLTDSAYASQGAPVSAREGHPDTARQIAIYRTDDLDAAAAALRARGAELKWSRPCYHGREAFLLQPAGMLIGLRQRDPASPLAADREGLRRRLRGEAFNPGCAPLPPHWQELGWVRMTMADLPAAIAFYRDIVGLRPITQIGGVASFELGDNTTLELVSGGRVRTPPKLQRDAESIIILRVTDFEAMMTTLRARGVAFPYQIYRRPVGSFSYINDPEGNLIGFADRAHPGSYVAKEPAVYTDLEARRRWVEATGTSPDRAPLAAA